VGGVGLVAQQADDLARRPLGRPGQRGLRSFAGEVGGEEPLEAGAIATARRLSRRLGRAQVDQAEVIDARGLEALGKALLGELGAPRPGHRADVDQGDDPGVAKGRDQGVGGGPLIADGQDRWRHRRAQPARIRT